MNLVRFVGKFFIVAAILFQACLLFQDKTKGDNFNRHLRDAISGCAQLQAIKPHL